MRVFFIGKQTEPSSRDAFDAVGRALGRAAAEQGFQLVVGSDAVGTLDRAVVFGAWEHRRDVKWDLFEPGDGRARYVTPGGPMPRERRSFAIGEPRWEFAHLSAALSADAVVGMGGNKNTRLTLRSAAERGMPIWPIPHFGGAAQEAFQRMSSDKEGASVDGQLAILSRKGLQGLAERVVSGVRDLTQRKARRHVYFLSYSHEDSQETDQMELFLRRLGRGVLRDESAFQPGGKLSEEAHQYIATADDVLVMDSGHAAASRWVSDELRYAYALQQRRANEARRVVGVLLQGMPPRSALRTSELHLSGLSRKERESAAERLVASERRGVLKKGV